MYPTADAEIRAITGSILPTDFVIANSASKSSATGFLFSRALRLYPPQEEMESYVEEDSARFLSAARQAMGSLPAREP